MSRVLHEQNVMRDSPEMRGAHRGRLGRPEPLFVYLVDMVLVNSLVELDVADTWVCGRATGTFAGPPKGGGDTINGIAKTASEFRKQPDGAWKYASFIFNGCTAGVLKGE